MQITLFNIWHYFFLGIVVLIFIGGLIAAKKQPIKRLFIPMVVSVSLVSFLLAGIVVVAVDKYTKIVELSKLKNKRLLNIEKITYSGMVINKGNYPIGEVIFEIKLVNKGHATGNVKAGSFFKASGFFDFFSGGANVLYKPQTIIKEFVVARNLKAGQSKPFNVYFDYPPYFKNVSQFATVRGR